MYVAVFCSNMKINDGASNIWEVSILIVSSSMMVIGRRRAFVCQTWE